MTRPPVLLLTHPGFGEGLLRAARSIAPDVDGIDLVTNEGTGPADLDERVRQWLDAHPGPAIVLTDLSFGSCCQTARRVSAGRADVLVASGVNLPMFLAVLRSRELPDLESLLRHLEERGREGVEVFLGGRRP